jgi:hypothetical protein
MATRGKTAMHETVVETRMWARFKCDYTTDCSARGDRWSCRIVDLGERGLGVISTRKLSRGAVVYFADPRTKAQVVWSDENRAGLRILN